MKLIARQRIAQPLCIPLQTWKHTNWRGVELAIIVLVRIPWQSCHSSLHTELSTLLSCLLLTALTVWQSVQCVQDGTDPSWDPEIHAVAAAMGPLLVILAPHLEGPHAHQMLANAVSEMLQGNAASIAFCQTVRTLLFLRPACARISCSRGSSAGGCCARICGTRSQLYRSLTAQLRTHVQHGTRAG